MYGLIQKIRRRTYPYLFERRHFQLPSILIGSIHVGGAGKTPFVYAVAKQMISKGKRVGILLRGYGRSLPWTPLWVQRPNHPLADVVYSGDEAQLLAHLLPDAWVLVSGDRIEGMQMMRDAGVDIVICDDGFQHLSFQAQHTWLLLPPMPSEKDVKLLPFGHLREGVDALHEADLVFVEEDSRKEWLSLLGARATQLAPKLRVYKREWMGIQSAEIFLTQPDADTMSFETFRKDHAKVTLANAIARPQVVKKLWEKKCSVPHAVVTLRDHSAMSESVLSQTEGTVVMTQKDVIKMKWLLKNPSLLSRVYCIKEQIDFAMEWNAF